MGKEKKIKIQTICIFNEKIVYIGSFLSKVRLGVIYFSYRLDRFKVRFELDKATSGIHFVHLVFVVYDFSLFLHHISKKSQSTL